MQKHIKNYYCKTFNCWNPVENQDTGLCASCAHEQRKLARTKLKEVKPIKKVSTKRNSQNQQYLRLRKEYLESYPSCEVVECHKKSTEIHHMAGRENDMLLDTNYFLAVCHDHHHKITVDSKWAIENGYSILRSSELKKI